MSRYIDAEALKREIESLMDSDITQQEHYGLRMARFKLIDAPTADVQKVKHGKWEFHAQDTDGMSGYFCCSNCYEMLPADHSKTNYMQRCNFRYCPNCGAKMEEEKE